MGFSRNCINCRCCSVVVWPRHGYLNNNTTKFFLVFQKKIKSSKTGLGDH